MVGSSLEVERVAKRTIKRSGKTGKISHQKARSAVKAVSGRYVSSAPRTTVKERSK